jgi:adenine-specific DNA-methyltransferase
VSKFRGYYENPHIVVGLGFRENGKIAAALDAKCYPWMGDIYHLLRDNNLFNINFDLEEEEVINFLISDYIQKYIKDVYREITYHLSITQLANLPLPDKTAWATLKKETFYE